MIIVGCSNSKKLGKMIAGRLGVSYLDLEVYHSAEGEMHVNFKHDVNGQTIILVQSFYPHPNNSLLEVMFAASNARDLGAKKVILVAPYLAYLREDLRYDKGECIGMKVLAEIINKNFDMLITVDPHFHEYNKIGEIFRIPVKFLSSADIIRKYINDNFKNYIVVSPNKESNDIAKRIDRNAMILEKIREDSHNVFFVNKELDTAGREVIIVDDIISTGVTMIEAIKLLKNQKKINCICVHATMVEDAFENLSKEVNKLVSTNTIIHETNEIDISGLIANSLKGFIGKV